MKKDINRRKILAIYAFKPLNNFFNSRKISNIVKIRKCNAYVASVGPIPLQKQTVDPHQKTGQYRQQHALA